MNGLSTTEELVDRHANLASRGMGNCRAAQALKKEITRRQLEAQYSRPETDSIDLSNWECDLTNSAIGMDGGLPEITSAHSSPIPGEYRAVSAKIGTALQKAGEKV